MLKRPLRCVLRLQGGHRSWSELSRQGVTHLHFCKTGVKVYQEDVLQGVVKHLNMTFFSGQ